MAGQGERVLLEAAPSRLLSFHYYLLIVLLLAAALALFLRRPWDPGEAVGIDLHLYAPTALGVASALLFVAAEVRRINHRYFVGETTVAVREGILSRRTQYVPYRQIERVEVDQSLLARLFNLGDVVIDTGEDKVVLRAIKGPGRVRALVGDQLAALAGEGRRPAAGPPR